jgi:hypothetical protein
MAVAEPGATAGAYLTDGKRLCQVVGVDGDGYLHLEDCSADIGTDSGTIRLARKDLLGATWQIVRPAPDEREPTSA